jgi:hypothetical protein
MTTPAATWQRAHRIVSLFLNQALMLSHMVSLAF